MDKIGKLIKFGDTRKLEGTGWRMLELRSSQTTENTLRRICKKVPGIFRGEAFEMFVIDARDSE